MPLPDDAPAVPGFQLEELVGEGYSGRVFRARREVDGQRVALKVLDPARWAEPAGRARFAREARLLAGHPHPALVPLLGAGLEGEPPWLAFAWMGGGDLRRHRKASRLLPPAEVHRAAARVGRALAHLHGCGVVHRDLKPANILRDGAGQAFLGDLGMGKDLGADQKLTATGQILGTWLYMAPEVQAGEAATPAADTFSLAMVLVELLTGTLPRRLPAGVRLPEHPALEAGPPGLKARLRACLRGEPEDRPGSPLALVEALGVAA